MLAIIAVTICIEAALYLACVVRKPIAKRGR